MCMCHTHIYSLPLATEGPGSRGTSIMSMLSVLILVSKYHCLLKGTRAP